MKKFLLMEYVWGTRVINQAVKEMLSFERVKFVKKNAQNRDNGAIILQFY